MKKINQFYYDETQSTVLHTRTPTGNLDVKELIEGRPCWISPVQPRLEKKKTLILADWTATHWSDKKITEVQQALRALIEQGFTLYFWDKDRLKPLTGAQLDSLTDKVFRKKITLAHVKDITRAAVEQNKLAADQVQVLDYYWVNELLSEKEGLGARVIKSSELDNKITYDENYRNLLCDILTTQPSIEYLELDSFDKTKIENAHMLDYLLPSVRIKRKFISVSLWHTQLSELVRYEQLVQEADTWQGEKGELTRGAPIDYLLHKDDLFQLEEIICPHDSSINMLETLLAMIPNIKKIKIPLCKNLDALFEIKSDSLVKLEELDVSYSRISSTNLAQFLKAAPKLKRINLNGCQDALLELCQIEPDSLISLEYLDLSEISYISSTNLAQLLQAAPNLKRINLSSCRLNKLDERFKINPNSLNRLEAIDLSHSSISSNHLAQFLNAAPNLKTINLSKYMQLGGSVEMKLNSLTKVKQIVLNNAIIPSYNLAELLNAAYNLQILDLSKCRGLKEAFTINLDNLTSLEEINLSQSTISSSNLAQLLKAASNLKIVDLSFCQYLDEAFELQANSLLNLEKLNLTETLISSDNLATLLNAAPNLKEINLFQAITLDEPIEIKPNSLSNLEAVNLAYVDISSDNLAQLLNAAPKLKTIDLYRCSNLNKLFEIKLNSFLNLEEIDLGHSKISSANLALLLNAAPNLKKIKLQSCEHIQELFEIKPNSLLNLETIDLDDSSISSANLTHLLNAAPNLKKINLDNCKNLDKLFEIKPNSLLNLDEIALNNASLSSDALAHILNAAPNLKTIELNRYKNLDKPLEIKLNSLLNIEAIDLPANLISANLAHFLNALPNLKTINLSRCINLGDLFEVSLNNHSYLESIDLANANIPSYNLALLLNASPNLKTIDLTECNNLDGPFYMQLNGHVALEAIDLSSSNISSANLVHFLNAASHIKTINLSTCRNVHEPFEIDLNNLINLEEINLVAAHISSGNLAHLLNAAPKLKKIDLSNCPNLHVPFEIGLNSLINLEELNLRESTLSSDNLIHLLKAAPNLKKINLSECKSRYARLNLEPNSLPNLEELNLAGCSFSRLALESLLKAAPNLNKDSKAVLIATLEAFNRATPAVPMPDSSHSKEREPIDSPPPKEPSPVFVDPKHNAKDQKSFVPADPNSPFEFKGENKTQNQGMIIEKLCQYLKKNKKHQALIPHIQDGICVPLSRYFNELSEIQWNSFMELVTAWDGECVTSAPLNQHFDKLIKRIQECQFKQAKYTYLGDNLNVFLNTLKPKSQYIISNPWHAIAIKCVSANSYQIYDPNYVGGYKLVTREMLSKTIQEAIGSLVCVDSPPSSIPCAIHDSNAFLEQGGLLALSNAKNSSSMLSSLENKSYSPAALDGLLLRDTSGRPAWLSGMQNKDPAIKKWAKNLLLQFLKLPNAYQQLVKSLEALTPLQKGECITLLTQEFNVQEKTSKNAKPVIILEQLKDELRKTNLNHYKKRLTTWEKTRTPETDIKNYCRHCSNNPKNQWPYNQLIELSSTQEVDALRIQLEQTSAQLGRAVFYIDKPDDLICSAPWLKKNPKNQTGTVEPGPGGPLHAFLQAHKDDAPILIVNYERFQADDLVKFNALLDKNPRADGTDLPPKTQIIGLMNYNKRDCYQGSDFYSRFQQIVRDPLSKEAWNNTAPPQVKTFSEAEKTKDNTIIRLYHSARWEEILLGKWVLDGHHLSFKEGALVNAIKKGEPIEIQQGPWNNEAFVRFWQNVMSTGVRQGERVIRVPESMQVLRPKQENYDWHVLTKHVTVKDDPGSTPTSAEARILNPSCLGDFFNRYELINEQLIQQPGWLEEAEKNKQTELAVHLTRTLTNDAWAMLLDECKRLKLTLNATCAPGVVLPQAWNKTPLAINPGLPFTAQAVVHDTLIISSDIDTTLASLTQAKINASAPVIIDISECAAADLLEHLDGAFNKKRLSFEFNQSEGALLTALAQKKTVILTGDFSVALQDALATFMHKRNNANAPGQIILVTKDPETAPYVAHRYGHEVGAEDKKAHLLNKFSPVVVEQLDNSILATESLSQLKARCHFLTRFPEAKSEDAFIGLKSITQTIQASAALDKSNSKEECRKAIQTRIDSVNTVLETSPYVFITGLSGVGKSTFVENELCQRDQDELYLTEHRIEQWAKDKSKNQRKVLFIDEANLSPRQWSEFEGLFNDPPTILINGTLHTLTKEHKVIFAGNPVNYGDERQLAPFFQRHGNTVLFTPLSHAVIYEKILKPVFDGIDNQELGDLGLDHILKIYDFICACSKTEVLITPRELQMIALLSMRRASSFPQEDVAQIVEHYAYALTQNLVPVESKKQFETQFKPKQLLALPTQLAQEEHFFVTPSRHALAQQLNELLDLRQWRRSQQEHLNAQQKAGGLGGIIIEGEPGIGKSELVIQTLLAQGYRERKPSEEGASPYENTFYRMDVSMSTAEKEELLIRAFNEGSVVLIDEINSSPMMERLLNDLLMGKNPRATKNSPPPRPGFMIIGTQNPVTMAGRRVSSTPLQRRTITVTLPEYESSEIKEILLKKGVEEFDAKYMVDVYQERRQFAIKQRLTPAPNFRDLMRLADDHILEHSKSSTIKPAPIPDQASADQLLIKFLEDFKAFQIQIQTKGKRYNKLKKKIDATIEFIENNREKLVHSNKETRDEAIVQCQYKLGQLDTEIQKHRGFGRLHLFIRSFLGFLAGILVLPALVVSCLSSSGYQKTFFGNPLPASSPKYQALQEQFKQITGDESDQNQSNNPN